MSKATQKEETKTVSSSKENEGNSTLTKYNSHFMSNQIRTLGLTDIFHNINHNNNYKYMKYSYTSH